ncbi:MAG TPA: T9SS type A sorting domain-containing protein, partial [Caldithrix abyssi]|nr:T9SS type A sorting domain-containing protein [Caldithrix abyssi]
VPFVQQGVGDNQSYKYYVVKADESTTWVDGWERPASQGGGNRDVEFAGVENQDASEETTYYDDVHPDWVIESGKDVSVVFSVDMAPAMDGDLQAVPFDPATDTLYWIGEMPSFVNTQGWEDVDEMRVLKLTDDDGDNIFSATLSLVTPTFNTFEYRYAWRSQDGSWTFEPAGFGDFAYRIRYIGQDGARSFPTLPWDMPTDTWTNQEDKSDQQEFDPFKSLTSIGHTPDVPTVYQLDQNYPNPFNPSTTIRFTVPVAGKVTLTVYNVAGQKIATLINGNVTAGSHTRVWNGKDNAGNQVASGVYFYKLTAEKFSATEKMILMK